jgi:hypothetical protein
MKLVIFIFGKDMFMRFSSAVWFMFSVAMLGVMVTIGCVRPIPTSPGAPPSTFTFTPTHTVTVTSTPTKTAAFTSTATTTFTYSPSLTSTSTPVSTSTPTVTWTSTSIPPATPTVSVPPTGIYWGYALYQEQDGGTSYVQLPLSVNGSAETTAIVTFTTPNGTISMPFISSGSGLALYQANNVNYLPGQPYTLTSVTSIGTATATVTATGPVSFSANGQTVYFTDGGNANYADVYFDYNSQSTIPSISSPFTIPTSAFTSTGQEIRAATETLDMAITGANPQSFFIVNYVSFAYYDYTI